MRPGLRSPSSTASTSPRPVERPDVEDLLGSTVGSRRESTAEVAKRVATARGIAATRGVTPNSLIPAQDLDRLAPLGREARDLLESRLRQGRLSGRGLHRVRRVARTVADLGGCEGPLRCDEVLTALALRVDVLSVHPVGP